MTSKAINLLLLFFIVFVSGCNNDEELQPSRGKVIADRDVKNFTCDPAEDFYQVCVPQPDGTFQKLRVRKGLFDRFPKDFDFVCDCNEDTCDSLEYRVVNGRAKFGRIIRGRRHP